MSSLKNCDVHPCPADRSRRAPACCRRSGSPREGQRLEQEAPAIGGDVDPARLQRASAPTERVLADGVDDRVVRLAVLREVLVPVVDDLVGAERPDELDVVGAADGRDVGAEVLGELHGRRAERARRAVDDDPPALADASLRSESSACEAPSQTAAASSKLSPAGLSASAARSRRRRTRRARRSSATAARTPRRRP